MPYFYNLRTDPYEFAHITSNSYWDWYIDHAWILYPMASVVGPFLKTFDEFPPVQKPGSFTIGDAFKTIQAVAYQSAVTLARGALRASVLRHFQ